MVTANQHGETRGLFDSFEAYRTPSDANYDRLLMNGLVVPDANVLLNLYRYNSETQQDLLAVLGKLDTRLWVPHQVLVEFWRNRESALLEPRDSADRTIEELGELRDKAIRALRTWSNRIALSHERVDDLRVKILECFGEVNDQVRDIVHAVLDVDAKEKARDTKRDAVLSSLEAVVQGKVGAPLSESDHKAAIAEGLRRVAERVPPGYKDKSKDDQRAAGDYVVWEQILREAERRRCDVMLITGDVKDDWWRKEHGEIRGPRLELVNEMRARAGCSLYILRPESLLIHAGRVLAVNVQDTSIEDVERVERSLSSRRVEGWTEESLLEFLSQLEEKAPTVQAAVFQLAAKQDGFVSRKDVYELGDYDESRTLRGFTRPLGRISQELRDAGLVAEDAPDLLGAVYESEAWSQASGFAIPKELVPLIKKLVTQRD